MGPNGYPRLVLEPKWNFGLDLNHNNVLTFSKTKSTCFSSKMIYNPHFCPKRTVWTLKGLLLDPNTVLKCFDTEILYYGSKGFWGLCLFDSFTLSQNFFLTCFDIKISHLGSNPNPQLVLLPKWNLGLDLKYKIVLVIWETKHTYFCSKMLYNTHFCPKRTVWT